MSNALAVITDDIYAARDGFQSVLAEPSLNFDREAGFAVQVLQSNEYALGTAMKNRQSVVNAITNIAAIGISLNPAKKQAYLVPRDGRICLDISYIGLMDLAMATGSIKWAQAELVYANDGFTRGRFDEPPTHTFNPFSRNRGEIVGVYCVVKTADGDYLTHTMDIDSVYAIRDRTASWKSGKSTPWKTDPGEMIKKTCVKQAYKYWPKTDRLSQAIQHLNVDGAEGITESAPAPTRGSADWVDVESLIVAAQKTTTDADALAFWAANNGSLKGQPECHKRFKAAVAAHRARLADEAARTIDAQVTEQPE
jgi:recombination protein RecT